MLENPDWWKPHQPLFLQMSLHLSHDHDLNTEKIEARRSGQKDGGGQSAANRSRNVEEVLFLMDPERYRAYTALNSTRQTISGGCKALITEKL